MTFGGCAWKPMGASVLALVNTAGPMSLASVEGGSSGIHQLFLNMRAQGATQRGLPSRKEGAAL
jgi:hypothetical protein